MKFTLVLLVAAAVLGCVLSCSVEDFENYKTEYNKVYADKADNDRHMENYCEALKSIEKHNQGDSTYKQGVNQFTDMSADEFKNHLGFMG